MFPFVFCHYVNLCCKTNFPNGAIKKKVLNPWSTISSPAFNKSCHLTNQIRHLFFFSWMQRVTLFCYSSFWKINVNRDFIYDLSGRSYQPIKKCNGTLSLSTTNFHQSLLFINKSCNWLVKVFLTYSGNKHNEETFS